jgi:hypothetical protein
MMVSLPCNLMIRRGMVPRSEGLRLHFIVNQEAGLFSAIAASSNMALNRSAVIMRFCFLSSQGRARLALRYV